MSFSPATSTLLENLAGTDLLVEMLTYKRPAGSDTERLFIHTFLAPLGAMPDEYGNYWIDVGPNPVVLFSSHTDTVHHSDGRQEVSIDKDGMITADVKRVKRKRSTSELDRDLKSFLKTGLMPKEPTELNTNCLGADCTTGVWLMVEMIRARVPGRYVFHREEEVGGKGSSHVARKEPERLKGIQFAIAFDRKGYHSIITEQMTGKCCSNAFAASLATILGADMELEPDPTGTFTDTANYADIIPECTNLSVGYFNQHGPKESQDMPFAELLLDRLINADWSQLVCRRDPEAEYRSMYERWSMSGGGGWRQDYEDEEEDDGSWSPRSKRTRGKYDEEFEEVIDLVADNPVAIAEGLLALGWSHADIEALVHESILQ